MSAKLPTPSKTDFNNVHIVSKEEVAGNFTAAEAKHLIDSGKAVALLHKGYQANGATGERFIYMYFTLSSKDKFANKIIFKIGMTSVDVATRVANQGDASSWERKYIADFFKIKKIRDDKELHDALKRKGVQHITDGDGSEWFAIPASDVVNGVDYVRNIIDTMESRPVGKDFAFRSLQLKHYNQLDNFISSHVGEANILFNMAPRYGKTPSALKWFTLMAEKRDHHTLLLPSYYLSTITSFKKCIVGPDKFNVFSSIEFIDMAAQGRDRLTPEQAEAKYNAAREAGKLVVIGISMYGEDENFEARYDWVSKLDKNFVTTIADEADFGIHTTNQRYKMDFLLTGNDNGRDNHVRIHMSGTNIQRMAVGLGINVDLYMGASYAEVYNSDPLHTVKKLHYFLDAPAFFAKLNKANKKDLMSYAKLFADAEANRETLKQIALGLTGRLTVKDELGLPKKVKTFDLSHITGDDIKCFMVGMNTTNVNMNLVADYWNEVLADDQLGKIKVVAVNGLAGFTNREAEDAILADIEVAQNEGYVGYIIISNMMGTRSFSVPQIQAYVNMKDRGSVDVSEQANSRCVTPGLTYNVDPAGRVVKERGHVIDLALDGNRQENIAALIIEEIAKIKRNNPGTTDEQAKREVLEAYDYMIVSELGGTVVATGDELNKLLTTPETLERIADVTVEPDAILDSGLMSSIADIVYTGESKQKKDALKKAEIYADKKKKGDVINEKDPSVKAMEKIINNAIKSINRSARDTARLTYSVRTEDTFRACLEAVIADECLADEFKSHIGCGADVVLQLLDIEGALNETILDALVGVVNLEFGQADDDFVNF